jgi:putative transposase
LVCERLKGRFARLRLLWADGAYAGELVAWVQCFAGWVLEIVKRPEGAKGFVLLPRRWVHASVNVVVERTFAWLMKCRRLCRDYEETTRSSEAWIQLAMIQVMAKRLARPDGKAQAQTA